MNVMSFESSGTSNYKSKCYYMKQIISAVQEYTRTKSKDVESVINRHLQNLSATTDLSVFDPHTSVASEFFVSLYELLLNFEQRSALAWSCVNVLCVACKNVSARNALIHTYQFIPPLSKLLSDHLTREEKIHLLNLLQELTCGIKISWYIPHLLYLMTTLTRWVECQDEDIVAGSLAVLVNLCYKNFSAVNTLSQCVDIKTFVRLCMRLQGSKVEVHICKLLIVLEYMNGNFPDDVFLKLTEVTFKSMLEAFKGRDSILLRHVVEFFLDVQQQHSWNITKFKGYHIGVEKLLEVVENNYPTNSGDMEHDPECVSQIFKFLQKLPKLEVLNPRIINVALKWTHADSVSSSALSLLHSVAINTSLDQSTLLEPILSDLMVYLSALEKEDCETFTHIEHNKRLGALMQLLSALVNTEFIRNKVLNALKVETIHKIFVPLFGNQSQSRANDPDAYSNEAIHLYIYIIAFVLELARHDVQWVNFQMYLMQQKQIHMILAQALHGGSQEVRIVIMDMASSPVFPGKDVAVSMSKLTPVLQTDPTATAANRHTSTNLCFPLISVVQREQLDSVINKFKEVCTQNNLSSVSTSDTIELYEYKVARLEHAERAAVANMEAASQRCIHFQHQMAQVNTELSRLHQLLFHVQQCYEDALKVRDALNDNNRELMSKLETEKGRLKVTSSQLAAREKSLEEKHVLLEEIRHKLKDVENAKCCMEEQNADLKRIVAKLEENLIRKEKVAEKKDELLNRANGANEMFKSQIAQLEKQLKQTEIELNVRTQELNAVSKDLECRKQLIDTITKLTSSQTTLK